MVELSKSLSPSDPIAEPLFGGGESVVTGGSSSVGPKKEPHTRSPNKERSDRTIRAMSKMIGVL